MNYIHLKKGGNYKKMNDNKCRNRIRPVEISQK
jgi:hypothetical protein